MEQKTGSIHYTLDQIDGIVHTLKRLMASCSVFTFTGSIGAGKTTLIRALLRQCGVTGSISSPTFTYLNVYNNNDMQTFYHFDLYRIGTLDEFIQAGFDEYLYAPRSWAFIEWPDPIMSLIDHNACLITINYDGQARRVLTYTVVN